MSTYTFVLARQHKLVNGEQVEQYLHSFLDNNEAVFTFGKEGAQHYDSHGAAETELLFGRIMDAWGSEVYIKKV